MASELLVSAAGPDLWRDNVWDRLLDSLEERCVIPIVGPDLRLVDVDGTPTLLDHFIATQLAATYDVPEHHLPAERPLHHVVCHLLRHNHNRDDIAYDIFQIMRKVEFAPSEPLRQLAEITHFNLFVSTTFDSLLEKAINEARFANAPETAVITYSPKKVEDLRESKEKLARPTVYYL